MALQGRILVHFRDQIVPAEGFESGVSLIALHDLTVGAFGAKIEPVQVLYYVLKIVSGPFIRH